MILEDYRNTQVRISSILRVNGAGGTLRRAASASNAVSISSSGPTSDDAKILIGNTGGSSTFRSNSMEVLPRSRSENNLVVLAVRSSTRPGNLQVCGRERGKQCVGIELRDFQPRHIMLIANKRTALRAEA